MPPDLVLTLAYPTQPTVSRQAPATACERVKVLTVLQVLHLRYTLVCTFDHCSSAFARILDLFCFLSSQLPGYVCSPRMCFGEIGVGVSYPVDRSPSILSLVREARQSPTIY
jgi:hypothetical protein